MEKYKICPYCGQHNPPKMLECLKCETDLSNVRVIDQELERIVSNNEHNTETQISTVKMVRICDCGTQNPVNRRKCISCGEDISYIIPQPENTQEERKTRFLLTSLDGKYAYELLEGREIIGREAAMQEYLMNKLFVSRNHAELFSEGDRLFIKNISHTNYSYVNNKIITDETVELKDGDELGLGGNTQNNMRQNDAAYFLVRIGTCL